jgi:hypothetical protein
MKTHLWKVKVDFVPFLVSGCIFIFSLYQSILIDRKKLALQVKKTAGYKKAETYPFII